MGFGLTRETVGGIVIEYLKAIKCPHPFKVCPSCDWWKGFMKRSTLTEKKPRHLSRKWEEGAKEETIKGFC